MVKSEYHEVKLIGINDRAKKLISYYGNRLLLREYDGYGKPLNIKDDKPAIFCVSPDGFWNGWFILDEDVRFQHEYDDAIKRILGGKKS